MHTMDVNYSRWMSTDPDAEPDDIEDEPRRFSLPRPARSVVASGMLVALVALGGGTLLRQSATSDASSDGPTQTVETHAAKDDSGPGAASVDDSMSDESTSDDFTSDDSDEAASDDYATPDEQPPTGPLPMDRRQFRRSAGLPPGGPSPDRPLRRHHYVDSAPGPALAPPGFQP